MKILALNCGSSTVKFQLFETSLDLIRNGQDRALAQGLVERIGSALARVRCGREGEPPVAFERDIPDHQRAIETVFECLLDPGHGALSELAEIDGVGHRMVHAGEHFSGSVMITTEVARRIEECIDLAPLHNPHNLRGYQAVRALLPDCPNAGVFDTAFHQTMPARAYLYALPYELYRDQRIRRYGFHGTSHRYVCQRYAEIHGSGPEQYKLISCHLGSGASICAIDGGRSVDTSLGFTPLEGLVMGTRAGDVDPGILLDLMARQQITVEEVTEMLNRRSGLLGISGLSNDMRELITASRNGNERARLAIDVFCYRVKKYIGSYYAVLNGADAVIFTGGIGENSPEVREWCCEGLEALGIRINPVANTACAGSESQVGAGETAVWAIPTNEELLIARDTVRLISEDRRKD